MKVLISRSPASIGCRRLYAPDAPVGQRCYLIDAERD